MAERFPVVVTEIDALVSSIATRIARLPPDRLLHTAWWEFAMLATGDVAHDLERTAALRMVDYVQSVIASVPPDTYAEEISKDEWNAEALARTSPALLTNRSPPGAEQE